MEEKTIAYLKDDQIDFLETKNEVTEIKNLP